MWRCCGLWTWRSTLCVIHSSLSSQNLKNASSMRSHPPKHCLQGPEWILTHTRLPPPTTLYWNMHPKCGVKKNKNEKLWRGKSNIDRTPHDGGDWRGDGPQERDGAPSGRDAENAIWWSNFKRAAKRNVFPRQEAPAPWAAAAFHPCDISCASLVKAVGPLVPSSSPVIF